MFSGETPLDMAFFVVTLGGTFLPSRHANGGRARGPLRHLIS